MEFISGVAVVLLLLLLIIIVAVRYYANGGLYRRYCTYIQTSLKSKTVVITGGNAGIGRETAIDLARRGARVIIACRNEAKAKVALQEIRSKSGNDNVDYYHLELSDQDSIRKFVQKFLQEEERLDILINNAGIGRSIGQRTKQGYDMVFGVNHFGHFLLTMLFLDRLKKCAPSRIITVSSMAHVSVSREDMNFSRGDAELKYPGLIGYDKSKICNIYFTRELAKYLEGTGVTAYSLHPGLIRTSIFHTSYHRGGSPLWRYLLISFFVMLLGSNEEAGAQTSIYCAVEESISHLSGRYFDNCQLSKESELAKDDGLAKKMWEVSCQATGINQ